MVGPQISTADGPAAKVANLCKSILRAAWTMVPGVVTQVNPTKLTCNVKIKLDDIGQDFKELTDVPVVFPRGGDSIIMMPIKVDDVVLVGFSKFSLDTLITNTQIVKKDLDIEDFFDVSHAVVIAGFVLENEKGSPPFEIPTDDVVIVSEEDLTVNCGTEKTLRLDKIVWDDLRIVPGAFQFTGSSDPTLSSWQPGGSGAVFRVYKFQKNNEVFALVQMPHTYKEGTDLLFHIHWTPCNRGVAESGNKVGWKVDYSIANIDGVFGSSLTVDLSHTCSGVDDKHELTSSVVVPGTGLTISHIAILRIYRSDTGADDTWAGTLAAQSPAILEFDIHFQIDTMGSRQELVK